MMRGVRGAITVEQNDADQIINATKHLMDEIIKKNNIIAEDVAQIIFSLTNDLDAAFPAVALRQLEGWEYVPLMCTREIPVQNSLEKCIRIMMTINTDLGQKDIEHVYLEKAIVLRPDLKKKSN